MEQFKKILTNVIIFLLIFMGVNYIFKLFQGEETPTEHIGTVVINTTEDEYSPFQTVAVKITNYTDQSITIPNDCPGEYLSVYRKNQNDWVSKTANPPLDCKNVSDFTLNAGESLTLNYENWNYALFSEKGRFKIAFDTALNGEEITIESNEFKVVEEGIIRKLWNGLFYRPIYNAMIFIASLLPNHPLGWAIIILTLIIRTIVLVPSQKAMKAQKRMQEIQPKLEKIKEKYKGDQQRIAMETMAIWKEAKISPLSSCMPLLIQFPFLIAIFYVVQQGINPDYSHFLYSDYGMSLDQIDIHFFGLNLTQPNLYVLPLIVGGLQFIQMKLTMARQSKKQKEPKNEIAIATGMMTYIMPVMIAVFTASLPSGVGVYWGTSTLYGIVQQMFINKDKGNGSDSGTKVRVVKAKD